MYIVLYCQIYVIINFFFLIYYLSNSLFREIFCLQKEKLHFD